MKRSRLEHQGPASQRAIAAPITLTKVTSLAERLRDERQRAFIGRSNETGLFRRLLLDATQSLLFVTGQVGVGKTALLQEYQRIALANGHHAILLDAQQLDQPNTSPTLLRQRLLATLEGNSSSYAPTRSVLLVDRFERLHTSHEWLLRELVSTLASDVLLVFASRGEVPSSLSLDAAWSRLMQRHELAPLTDADATKFLEYRGVAQEARDAVLELAAGYPLALALAAELVVGAGGVGFDLVKLQELQHALARQVCPPTLSRAEELALDTCSLARAISSELLEHVRRALGTDTNGEPEDAFNWLSRQSFVEWTPLGLRPHVLVRVAAQARLRRERPRRHRAILQALREFSVGELETSSSPEADLVNLFFLDRNVPLVRRWTPPLDTGPLQPLSPAEPADRRELTELVRKAEGNEAAQLISACFERDGDLFEITRNAGVTGLVQYTRLDHESRAKLSSKDPVSAPLARFMADNPLEHDEESLLCRWFIDAQDYQTPSARVLALTARLTQLVLSGKRVAYSFCVFRNPADWVPLWKDISLPWQVVDRFRLGDHEYSLVVFLWRRRSLREVLVQAWRQPEVGTAPAELTPSFDELRVKVAERVATLGRKIKLTPRELEILEQLCLGHSLDDVAKNLSIRPRTVKFHQENLLRKTGASSRVELFRKLL